MKYYITLFLSFIFITCFAQTDSTLQADTAVRVYSKHSIKVAIGAGYSQNNRARANGGQLLVGYQRQWGKRFRFNPSLTYGRYTTSSDRESHDRVQFNSFNIQCLVYADVIKIKRFSLVAGTGAAYNFSFGKDYNNAPFPYTGSGVEENFTQHYGAMIFSAGIRVDTKGPVAFDILSVSGQVGTGNDTLSEVILKTGVDIKLK